MSDKRAATLGRLLGETHPSLPETVRAHLATQLIALLDTSVSQGYDLTEATIQVKGAKRTSIGNRLKTLREQARLRQEDVTARSKWHAAKVSRIESGAVPVSHVDTLFLLQLYGVRDARVTAEVTELARLDREARTARRRAA